MHQVLIRRHGARLALLLWGLLAARASLAQGWLGLAQSNYGGTHNAYINPSSIADSRHRFYLNLGGADAHFYNTYLRLDLPQQPWAEGFKFQKEYLQEQLTGNVKFGSVSAEVRLPSFMLPLGPRAAIAFTSRVRAFVQASNVSENLARLARNGLGNAAELGLANRVLTDNSFNLNANSYHEFALTYARTLTPNTTHFFKGGLTVKYLVGLGGGYVLNEGTDYQVYNDKSIQLRTPSVQYAYTSNDFYKQSGFGVGTFYGGQQLGRGYGADLGLTYEWRPDYAQYRYHLDGTTQVDDTRNKYRLRLGLALTDLGAVRYASDRYVSQAALDNTRTVRLNQLDTIHFNNLKALTPTLQRIVGLSEQSHRFTSYLPTALRLTADYQLLNHVYAGLLWTQNLLPARTIGSRTISSLALTPRLEFRRAEVAVPLILANDYHKLQVGIMLRLGPLIVGSDNLGGLVGITSSYGADAYFGLSLALQRHRRKDHDGDLVSDKYDKCPKEKGTWALRGCPAPAPAVVAEPLALPPPPAPTPEATPATAPPLAEPTPTVPTPPTEPEPVVPTTPAPPTPQP